MVHFNSHAHVERDTTTTAEPETTTDFNSHAHVERDNVKAAAERMCAISTHTLTWSVTNRLTGNVADNIISTHTLTWSVTNSSDLMRNLRKNFNSHAHVERDLSIPHNTGDDTISTHTLTWSVTQQSSSKTLLI